MPISKANAPKVGRITRGKGGGKRGGGKKRRARKCFSAEVLYVEAADPWLRGEGKGGEKRGEGFVGWGGTE